MSSQNHLQNLCWYGCIHLLPSSGNHTKLFKSHACATCPNKCHRCNNSMLAAHMFACRKWRNPAHVMSVRIKHTEHYFHYTLFQTWGLTVIQMHRQGQVSPHQTRRAHMSQIHSGILLPGREEEWRGLARPVSRAPQVTPSGQIGQPQVPHPFCCSSLCHSIPPPS